MTTPYRFNLYGGMDENQPSLSAKENLLLNAVNVEHKETGNGYRRILGYEKWDDNEVDDATFTGDGRIRGVAYFNGACYVARNTSNDSKLAVYKSTGSGWTTVKTGLEPDGQFEFDTYSFAQEEKLYGADGKNKAFEIDDTDTYTAITTGLTTDKPAHLALHRNRIWLTYASSVLYSDVGDPSAWLDWAALSGEIVMKGESTALTPTVGGSLVAFARNQLAFMSGTGSESTLTAEYLIDHGNRIGAYANTVQQLAGRTLFLDDQGVIELKAAQEYGDFRDSTISSAVYPTIQSKRGNATASCIVRSKSQYRLFYSDGTGLIFSMLGDRVLGVTKLSWPKVVRCVWSGEDSSGNELILFGSDDGFIYQMESGNSLDGTTLTATMTTAFTPCRYPRQVKRFRRAIFDISASSTTSLIARPIVKLDKSSPIDPQTLGINAATAYLGTAVLGAAVLGVQSIQEGRIDMPVIGDYVAMQVSSQTTMGDPWELDGLAYEFNFGKKRR